MLITALRKRVWKQLSPHSPSPCTAQGEKVEKIGSEVDPRKKGGRRVKIVLASHYPALLLIGNKFNKFPRVKSVLPLLGDLPLLILTHKPLVTFSLLCPAEQGCDRASGWAPESQSWSTNHFPTLASNVPVLGDRERSVDKQQKRGRTDSILHCTRRRLCRRTDLGKG